MWKDMLLSTGAAILSAIVLGTGAVMLFFIADRYRAEYGMPESLFYVSALIALGIGVAVFMSRRQTRQRDSSSPRYQS